MEAPQQVGRKHYSLTMLPKKTRAKLVTDFRPIANIRLFYKVFAYMVLARVEQSLESFQPEAQHGFRSGRRMEEHVLTTNLVLDKSRAAGLPLWIISLDLSKAFDTVNWETLWEALRRQNISNQLVWILQCLYHNQTGVVRDGAGDSRTFDIFSGVRQGCVLSPRLFCAALELAMSEWRLANPHGGVDLGDAMPRLLDLRFADDILIFCEYEGRGAKFVGQPSAAFKNFGINGRVGVEHFKNCGINNGSTTTFFHSGWG